MRTAATTARQLYNTSLDVAVDASPVDEAENGIKQQVDRKILDFQDCLEGQCALIFWMADDKRWYEVPGDTV